jgi:hypothetical protein
MLGSKPKERESPESAPKSTHPFHPRPLQNIRVRGDHVRGSDHVTNFCELHRFMNMYNYFLKARVSLRTLSSLVINLFTQVAIVLELALVSSHRVLRL